MCTPGLTAPLAARVKPSFSVREDGKKSTDDASAAFVACDVTLPLPVSSPFLKPGAVCFRGRSDRLPPIACRNFTALYTVHIYSTRR